MDIILALLSYIILLDFRSSLLFFILDGDQDVLLNLICLSHCLHISFWISSVIERVLGFRCNSLLLDSFDAWFTLLVCRSDYLSLAYILF